MAAGPIDIPLEDLAFAHEVMNRLFVGCCEGRLKSTQYDTVTSAASGRRVLKQAIRDVYGEAGEAMMVEQELRLD